MYRQPNLTLLVNTSRSNSVDLESLVQHTMFQEHRTFGSELDFVIYGHGNHLDHVSETILTKFTFPLSKRAPHKIWPCLAQRFREKLFENNDHTHVYSRKPPLVKAFFL